LRTVSSWVEILSRKRCTEEDPLRDHLESSASMITDDLGAVGAVAAGAFDRAVFEVELGEQDNEPVPGAATGMVVSTIKSIGSKLVKTHLVDIKLLEELRATEQQIARELGQWVDKADNIQTIMCVEDIPTAVLEDAIRRGEAKLQEMERQRLLAAGDPSVIDVTDSFGPRALEQRRTSGGSKSHP
jgi:hypothetical protein